MLSDADGRVSSRIIEKSRNETKEKQKICEKSVPNWIGRFAKYLVQSSKTKKIQAVAVVYSATVVCLDKI